MFALPGELGEVVPRNSTVKIPPLDEEDAPAIRQRTLRNYGYGHVERITVPTDPSPSGSRSRQKLQLRHDRTEAGMKQLGLTSEDYVGWCGQSAAWWPQQRLGSSYYALPAVHAFGGWWNRFGAEHPQWFALQRNGARTPGRLPAEREKLCFSNPQLVQQVIQEKIAKFQRDPGRDSVSVSPNDGGGNNSVCLCQACRRLDPVNGRPMPLDTYLDGKKLTVPYVALSDRTFTFYNQVAEGVAKVFPDKLLGTYAYATYRDVPLGVRPHPNLLVGFVGMGYWDDEQVKQRIEFLEAGLRYGELQAEVHRAFFAKQADKASLRRLLDERYTAFREIVRTQPFAVNVAYICWREGSMWNRTGWKAPAAIVNSPHPQSRATGQTSRFYVAVEENGANDDNDGTQAVYQGNKVGPWRTIQRALRAARPGATIFVGSGRYREELSITTPRIRLRAIDGARPLLDGENVKPYGIRNPDTASAEDVVIEGFEIANQWIRYEIDGAQAFTHLILVPVAHKVEFNVRRYEFAVSDDSRTYRRLRAGENNDSGSWFIYEFDKPVSTKFLKFTMVDKFPDDGYTWTLSHLEFDELRAGRLVPPQLHDAQGDSE